MSSPVDASLEALVGRVADEYTERAHRGERPSIEEYVAKYPHIADVLRQVLPAIVMLQQPEVGGPRAEADPYLGKTLGDFKLVRKIGHGGMGVVYEARQLSLDRRVAVKILPEASALNPRRLQRFKIEAMAAASLNHEHIVPVHFVGCESGVHFYVMQYIDGPSLAAVLKILRRGGERFPLYSKDTTTYAPPHDTPPTPDSDTSRLTAVTSEGARQSPEYFQIVAQLGLEAAKGLEHAHQHIVWHRDIKPGNLLIDSRGSLWIADFGLAHMRDADLTATGEVVGTLRYMSPEQSMGNCVPIDQRTDIYSLGATLYELLTLEPLFRGNDRRELLRQVVCDDPRPPRRLNRHVPRDLETIVMTAIAKAPADRYRSARELAEDLHRFLNDQPIKARPEALPQWLWRRSRRHASKIGIGLAALTTAVVLVLLLVQLNRPSPEDEARQRRQEALTSLTHELDARRKVALIGERGAPGYFQWRTSEDPGKVLTAEDGAFSIQSWEHGLVELLPDPRMERYRFRAEVRHERQAHYESRVGVYFAHRERRDGDNVAHFHCNVAFNDLIEQDEHGHHPGNGVGLQVHRQFARGRIQSKVYVNKAQAGFRPAKAVGALGPWRGIAIEVRPQSIKVYWQMDCNDVKAQGKCIADIRRDVLLFEARPLIGVNRPLPADTPRFSPRDGLGLYISMGVASFRNVIVEPLVDED